jgi:DNA-directed RNA polymerase specialized sigma24 family protein
MNINLFISIISLAFCLFFFFFFKWYIKRRTSASELLSEYRTEVYRLIAEIDSATDRDSLLVEDRIKKLKDILEDTDKRIAVYTRELDRSRAGEALYTSLGKGIRAALKTPPPAPQAELPPEQSANTQPLTVVRNEGKPSVPQPAQPQQSPAQEASAPSHKSQSRRQIRAQIETLANEGLSPSEIASRLDISVSEVDLAMNLIRRR